MHPSILVNPATIPQYLVTRRWHIHALYLYLHHSLNVCLGLGGRVVVIIVRKISRQNGIHDYASVGSHGLCCCSCPSVRPALASKIWESGTTSFPTHENPLLPSLLLVVFLAMSLSVMLVLQEHVFISAVCRKRHGRDAQAREGSLEAVPPAEESSVSPPLAVIVRQKHVSQPCS